VSERDELKRLRRENEQLRMERDILRNIGNADPPQSFHPNPEASGG